MQADDARRFWATLTAAHAAIRLLVGNAALQGKLHREEREGCLSYLPVGCTSKSYREDKRFKREALLSSL